MGEAGHFVGSLEKGDTLFEHIGGGVHETGIDVPELAQGEEVGGVLCVFEGKGRSFIDREWVSLSGVWPPWRQRVSCFIEKMINTNLREGKRSVFRSG